MGLNIQDLKITSDDVEAGERLDQRHAYTGEGDNVPPTLRVSGVPEGTAELAIICHDPDAPLPDGFTHWVLYGVPADVEVISADNAGDFTTGPNDFGESGYGGPMPPEGHGTHHYYFWVYALDTAVDADPGLSRAELLDRISDHIIEQNRLVATYSR